MEYSTSQTTTFIKEQTPDHKDVLTYQKWPSGVLPAEEIDIQKLLSKYQTSVDSEIQYLKDQMVSLIKEVILQTQIIKDLQKKEIIPIQNLRSLKLQLKAPLYVSMEYNDGVFVVYSDDLNLYGEGEIELNAIRDFCEEVENLYFSLQKSKDKLGQAMEENWRFLKSVIKEL